MEELKLKWDLILQTLKNEYDIQDISFKTWIKPLQLYSLEGDTITLLISEENMGINYIEKKYLVPLTVTICEIMGHEYEVKLVSANSRLLSLKNRQVLIPLKRIRVFRISILTIHLIHSL